MVHGAHSCAIDSTQERLKVAMECRWAVLARKPFTHQLKAPEFFALGLFFALNVLVLQFYLGTARIQLEELSASNFGLYVQLLSFIVPGEIPCRFVQLSCACSNVLSCHCPDRRFTPPVIENVSPLPRVGHQRVTAY